LEAAVIGENEQPFAVAIEPTGCINAGNRDVVGQARAAFMIGELAQYVKGFVKYNNLHASSFERFPSNRSEHLHLKTGYEIAQ
jgi:hypothetical protein